jgi:hypothetical protein
MADYVRYRIATAKLGVTMALMGLLGGLASKAGANPAPQAHKAAAVDFFLKLDGISGNLAKQFVKLELKIDALIASDHKLTKSFYSKHKIDNTFLKIDKASTEYLKIDMASAEFLKLDSANANFLKITDANTNFLKINDANTRFLKIDATATDSSKLGGMTPDKFFQGHGNVTTGEKTISDAVSTPTQMMGDGSVRILIGLLNALVPQVTLQNDSAESLNFTTNDPQQAPGTIKPGGGQSTALNVRGSQLDVQIFSATGKVWTLTVSSVPDGAGGHMFVGQLLNSQP